jgi:hypothetical protein
MVIVVKHEAPLPAAGVRSGAGRSGDLDLSMPRTGMRADQCPADLQAVMASGPAHIGDRLPGAPREPDPHGVGVAEHRRKRVSQAVGNPLRECDRRPMLATLQREEGRRSDTGTTRKLAKGQSILFP